MTRTKTILLLLFALLLLWLGGFAWFVMFSAFLPPADPSEEKTDAVVVLTGGDMRIETGLNLYAEGLAPNLFISGVHPDVTKFEIMQMWKGYGSLPECCLTLGYHATTTAENAQEIKEWIGPLGYRSIRLVTANYHMPRALLEVTYALPGIKIIPHPIVQPDLKPSQEWFWRLMAIEYHKTLFRRLTLFGDYILSLPGKISS